jgi:hypothetical protein
MEFDKAFEQVCVPMYLISWHRNSLAIVMCYF